MTTATSPPPPDVPSKQLSRLLAVLGRIERLGNKLPHPFWLFGVLSVVLALVSWLLSATGASALNPATGKTMGVRSLVSGEGLRMMISDAVTNYATFPPLGTILVVMLGVAVADRSGLLPAMLRAAVARVPARWLTFTLAFTAMVAHVASDAAYVVLVPLGAMAFRAVGRSPMLGAVVAFVSVSAGYDASPLVTPTDAVLAGLTTAAAHTVDPSYVVNPLSNYFFSVASSVVLAIVVTVVTEKVIARRVAAMPEEPEPDDAPEAAGTEAGGLTLRPEERSGLRNAGVALLAYAALVVVAMAPPSSPLRGEGGSIVESPVLTGIAVVLAVAFLIVGAVYGRTVGTVRTGRDIPDQMAQGLREMAPILVLFFAISQFLAYFKWTGVGEVLAIRGAGLLKSAGITGPVAFLGVLLVCTVINLLVTSGSAQWALVSPVFVPMFMLLDIPPEVTQAVYRIADSCTNAATPMSAYFVMTLGVVQRYRRSAGIGTLLSLTLPLCLVMLAAWTLLFYAWWALGIPLGPGVPVR
ncbi:putative p-aminobenzoyl-glutamate transport protein [Streptomyces afghaniensis 772]|uniref:Putative p-aminobenzoyl-glutamate transport protein n=1 Tax=Streptomyces afghaniensis 772 TaxID=1283301 RepID=S4MYW4_9ACTN|nr:AbgT family transporter [Streptomyces afghaniensis]EPJ41275.1 putative p-aminobenzoyl-glutamate transport protein [Streptomyces afghaniensis 772]